MTFLVSFGANMWALDNDLHTPLDVAVLNNHHDIVKYLDEMIAQQSMLNKKVVRKLKEKSVLEAHKRVKKYEKLQQKAQRKAEKEERLMAKERERMHTGRLIEENMVSSHNEKNGVNGMNGTLHNGVSNGTMGSMVRSPNKALSRSGSSVSQPEPKPFSAYVNNNHSTKKPSVLGGVAKKIKQQKGKHPDSQGSDFKIGEIEYDGKRTIRSLSGLQRDHHVMYVKNGNNSKNPTSKHSEDSISRALSEPEFNYSEGSGGDSVNSTGPPEAASMFERPGFGNVAFINRRNTSGALMSLPSECTDIDTVSVVTNGVAGGSDSHDVSNGRLRRRGSLTDSIGTVGSLAARMKNMPWGEEEVGLDEDETDSSPLELFLSANGLSEYLMVFTREKIDLSALMLLSDSDMKEIGLPMGPRRKLLDAIARRKRTLENPGVVMDTLL